MPEQIPLEDLLVGGVSMVIGGVALAAAIGSWEWFYQLRIAQRIESAWGRGLARLYYAVVGCLLIVLGAAIMWGFKPIR